MLHVTRLTHLELLLFEIKLLLKSAPFCDLFCSFIDSGYPSVAVISTVAQVAIFNIEAE